VKISNPDEAKEVYDLLVDIVDKAKRQYELKLANGRHRHQFDNLCLTVNANISVLGKMIIAGETDITKLQLYVDLGVDNAYKLAKWVGEQLSKIGGNPSV
jgi:zona occludens toxin (predicted ATPase)